MPMFSLVTQLEEARKAYGDKMSNDECADMLNAVLWEHGKGEYALCKDRGGNFARRFDGAKVEVDGIVYKKDRTFIDVLKDGGGASKPAWQVHAIGRPRASGEGFYGPHLGPLVEPIAPQAATPDPEPDPIKPVGPDPEPEPQPMPDYATAVDALIGKIAALESEVATLKNRVAAAERQWIVPGEMLRRIEVLEQAEYRVVPDSEATPISTSRLRTNLTAEVRVRVDRVR